MNLASPMTIVTFDRMVEGIISELALGANASYNFKHRKNASAKLSS